MTYRYNQVTSTTTYEPVNVVRAQRHRARSHRTSGVRCSPRARRWSRATRTWPSGTRASPRSTRTYLPNDYYNYAVEIPAGASGGEVWIFDPGFCDGSSSRGTGENWTVGAPNGYASREAISSYFDLYDTNNTPYDNSDDSLAGRHRARRSASCPCPTGSWA